VLPSLTNYALYSIWIKRRRTKKYSYAIKLNAIENE
jgi:hypothetical protein